MINCHVSFCCAIATHRLRAARADAKDYDIWTIVMMVIENFTKANNSFYQQVCQTVYALQKFYLAILPAPLVTPRRFPECRSTAIELKPRARHGQT